MKRSREHGFTLIEVLVAIALSAAAMTLSYRALSAVLSGSDVLNRRLDAARDLDRLFARIEREMLTRLPGVPYQSVSGGPEHLVIENLATGPDGTGRPQSSEYRLDQHTLVLTTRVGHFPPRREVLFDAVRGFELRFLSPSRRWQLQWSAEDLGLPRAVELRIAVGEDEVTRVFALP